MNQDVIYAKDETEEPVAAPERNKEKKMPKANGRGRKKLPEVSQEELPAPEKTQEEKKLPEADHKDRELPEAINEEVAVEIGGKKYEIKPTALRYQRDRTAMFYRVLSLYPLPDLLATDKGVFDPDRDGDKCLFDWLCAVFDDRDGSFVKQYYNDMTTETIERILAIYKKVNKIDEKEEQAKNRAAKGMSR